MTGRRFAFAFAVTVAASMPLHSAQAGAYEIAGTCEVTQTTMFSWVVCHIANIWEGGVGR